MSRIFSIFQVYDYKGGELGRELNCSMNDVADTLIGSGLIKHKDLGHWEDLYSMEDNKIREVISECEFDTSTYAYYDGGFTGAIFEHKDNKLVEVNLEIFRPAMADSAIKNKG